jgi:hypothetical protein
MRIKKAITTILLIVLGLVLISVPFYLWFSWNLSTLTPAGVHPFQESGMAFMALGFLGSCGLFLEGVKICVIDRKD